MQTIIKTSKPWRKEIFFQQKSCKMEKLSFISIRFSHYVVVVKSDCITSRKPLQENWRRNLRRCEDIVKIFVNSLNPFTLRKLTFIKKLTLNGDILKTRTNWEPTLRFSESLFNFLQISVIFPGGYWQVVPTPVTPGSTTITHGAEMIKCSENIIAMFLFSMLLFAFLVRLIRINVGHTVMKRYHLIYVFLSTKNLLRVDLCKILTQSLQEKHILYFFKNFTTVFSNIFILQLIPLSFRENKT